jgi:hypothetical protein
MNDFRIMSEAYLKIFVYVHLVCMLHLLEICCKLPRAGIPNPHNMFAILEPLGTVCPLLIM